MAKKYVPTEEEIIRDLTKYIESKKRNRPSALSPIKKEARTRRICDLVFSRPDIFKLDTEIKYVPMDVLTTEMLIRLVLSWPKNISLLDDDLISTEIMVAYEFSKRRNEHIEAINWGSCGLKFEYPNKIHKVRDSISDLCDELDVKFNDEDILRSFTTYIDKVSEAIITLFERKKDVVLTTVDKVVCKYESVDINCDKPTLILISGNPDSGKTTFGKMLHYRIKDSICLDSDELAKRSRELDSLERLNSCNAPVVIFSDPNADHYFNERSMEKYNVINIVVVPRSIEKMYRHSKHKQVFPYEEFESLEKNKAFYEGYPRDITVVNDYDERLWGCVDDVLEDMSILLEFDLPNPPEQKKLERI